MEREVERKKPSGHGGRGGSPVLTMEDVHAEIKARATLAGLVLVAAAFRNALSSPWPAREKEVLFACVSFLHFALLSNRTHATLMPDDAPVIHVVSDEEEAGGGTAPRRRG